MIGDRDATSSSTSGSTKWAMQVHPTGASVSDATSSRYRSMTANCCRPMPIIPSPPALATAAASVDVAVPLMPACCNGHLLPTRSVKRFMVHSSRSQSSCKASSWAVAFLWRCSAVACWSSAAVSSSFASSIAARAASTRRSAVASSPHRGRDILAAPGEPALSLALLVPPGRRRGPVLAGRAVLRSWRSLGRHLRLRRRRLEDLGIAHVRDSAEPEVAVGKFAQRRVHPALGEVRMTRQLVDDAANLRTAFLGARDPTCQRLHSAIGERFERLSSALRRCREISSLCGPPWMSPSSVVTLMIESTASAS